MKVLVTGAGGFIGAAAVEALLARGDSVVAFDTQYPAGTPSRTRISVVRGDITDMAAVAHTLLTHRPDAVIHAAAIVGVLSSIASPITLMRVNIEGALNVFEAMRLAGVKRCVHISSEEAYGHFRSDPVDENHPLDAVYPYGISKATVEQLGRTYRDVHGLEVLNVRTCSVYGAGLPRDRIPKNVVEAALAGRALHIASGADMAIDHTYIDDTIGGTLAILDHGTHRFDAYNIASGRTVTLGEIVGIVRELVPGADLSIGPGWGRHGDQIDMVRKGALDVTRAATELGWRPQYDIRAGLAAYITAMKQRNTRSA